MSCMQPPLSDGGMGTTASGGGFHAMISMLGMLGWGMIIHQLSPSPSHGGFGLGNMMRIDVLDETGHVGCLSLNQTGL